MRAEKHSIPFIANSVGISESTVKRTLKRSKETGDVDGGCKKSGPTPKFDIWMQEVITGYIELTDQVLLKMVLHVPTAYLHEFAIVFEEIFHLKISTSPIHKIFQAHGINRKLVAVILIR